ncbi:MAG: glycosyltransferase family 4 protein, partial [Leeuwenhoekiella sp.]
YIGNKLADKGASPTSIDILGPLLEKEGYEVYYASEKKNKVYRMLDMFTTGIEYRHKIDYVLIDTYSTSNFWYAVMIGMLCKHFQIPYIPLLRGGNLPERLKNRPKASRNLFKNAYFNVAPSTYLQEIFKKRGFQNTILIPNSIPLHEYHFKLRESFKPKLLWVRAFAEIYNPLLAIKILEQLIKTYPDATLCMVGADKDGSLKKCRDYAEKQGILVNFTGKLSKKEWLTLAEDHDLFINTTHYDNTPVSVIEAMALGLPVITTSVGGIPYLLRDGKEALLVADNDLDGFIKGVGFLVENPENSKQMATTAREKVEGFDWRFVKQEWHRLLR